MQHTEGRGREGSAKEDCCCTGGSGVADHVNRWLTAGLMVLFGGILWYGGGHADAALLTVTSAWSRAPAAVPIVFLALVKPLSLNSESRMNIPIDMKRWGHADALLTVTSD